MRNQLLLLALVTAAPGATAQEPATRPNVLTVAADGSAQFVSIQAAIAAAPDNARIEIAAGTYRERLVVGKPLVLAGAGWQQTVIAVDYDNPIASDPALTRRLQAAVQAADAVDRPAVHRRFLREHGPQPTLLVQDATGVTLSSLQLRQPGPRSQGTLQPGAIVGFVDAAARMIDCAIVDGPANGVDIDGSSVVELRSSLIAAVAGTGIRIAGIEEESAPHVTVLDCDVRGCDHRGITVGRGNPGATITRCRISGSSWHGIRYDDCAPTISRNLIFDNARMGIYASGTCEGTVTGNVFVGNGMGGISCWFHAADRIAGNTFVGNGRAAVEVLGAARPLIERNLFVDEACGVRLANVSGNGAASRSTGEVQLADNVFWQVAERVRGDDSGAAGATGNREQDPELADRAARDFTLPADSPLRQASIGVASPIPFRSPWPRLDAETRTAK